MKVSNKLYALQIIILVSLILAVASCTKKSNGYSNGQVLITPYTLYFSDTNGAIYHSNDGKNSTVVVVADGVPCKALCTSGNNLLYIKSKAYMSADNGMDFNHSYDSILSYPQTAINGITVDENQTMIINSAAYGHMYLTSSAFSADNILGFVWSIQNGVKDSWYFENYYDTIEFAHNRNNNVTSFTELSSGVMVAYDAIHNRVFHRLTPFDTSTRWRESLRINNDTLPDNPPLLGQGFFFIGHVNNQLIAVDSKGYNGAYYSNDTGITWFPMAGLPANTPMLSICSPFEQTCLVGTDSGGVYILNVNSTPGVFQPSNNGLPKNTVVRGITYHENIFSNNTTNKYIYLATNKGIYQSTDGGFNWVQTVPGNFTAIY